jgi:epoxyqueuosine reductase
MNPRAAEVLRGLSEAGLQGRIVPAQRIIDIGYDILSLKNEGLLDKEFYDMYMSKYKYGLPESMPGAKSLIIIAVPTTGIRLTFMHKGRAYTCIVPPTYAHNVDIDKKVKTILEKALDGGRVVKGIFPFKTLAARTGLARYGKNNITYAEGCGSFHRLTSFYTEVDLETDHWQKKEVLSMCGDCELCLRACPTGAIKRDRFLLRADKCLTFHNEMPSERAFGAAIKLSAHNAIVGCMRCQEACPMNEANKGTMVDGEVYTEEETDYLLKGEFQNEGAEEIMEKLERSGLDLSIFPRNLIVLIEQADGKKAQG